MTALSKSLLCALALMLTSCASSMPKQSAYLPPRVDCAEYEAPQKKRPSEPALSEKSLIVWQLYAYGLGDYAEGLLEQRIATAVCMQANREAGNIR